MKKIVITMGLLVAGMAAAAVPKMDYKTIGNAQAPKGGTYTYAFPAEPEKLNPINSQDIYAQYIYDLTMDGLLVLNQDTYEFEPGLAESYEVSKDGMTYTFKLRKDLKWSDGKPLTAEDVKFSFDSVKDPKYGAVHRLPYYETIGEVKVIDPLTVQISTTKKYYMNLEVMSTVGYTTIVPKHVYSDPTKKMNKSLVGSGPYMIGNYNKGKDITLVRNPNWWGKDIPHMQGKFNFDKLLIRFVKEENLALEMLKKNQIDSLGLTPEQFIKKTEGAPFGSTIIKVKTENADPDRGYTFVGWNFKNPIFQDRDVRVALAHLMNREEMNKKFRYSMADYVNGPNATSNPFNVPTTALYMFNMDKAKQLLAKAGWTDADKNGILEKTINGKPTEFKFSLLLPTRDYEKYFTLYKEDLKKAGIDMEIKVVEWNSLTKALDEQKFDAVTLGWGGGSLENDQKQIWHSTSAKPGGSNFISYSNPKVDQLIDEARQELDNKKRGAMWREVHRMIAEDAPYAWMFNEKYILYGVNKKIQRPKDTFKYNIGKMYWWSGN